MSRRLKETQGIVMVLETVLGAKVKMGHAGHRGKPQVGAYVGHLHVLNLDRLS